MKGSVRSILGMMFSAGFVGAGKVGPCLKGNRHCPSLRSGRPFSPAKPSLVMLFLLATAAAGMLTDVNRVWAAPTVTSYQPANGVSVPVSTAVQATFSETMDPATITTGSFTLSKFVGIKSIDAGVYHTVALKNDGTVAAWGYNNTGQATIPAGLIGVTAIAAGDYHTVALKNDGTVVAWGYNYYGQTTVPAGLAEVTAIAAGYGHTVALKDEGTVVAWGDNTYGETTVPAGLTGVTAIAAGYGHTVALKNDGTVVAWGDNTYGQTTVPAGLTGVTAIAAGYRHTVALKNDGTAVAWGDNAYGTTTVPAGLTGVTAIAAGSGHTVALKSDGTVVAWGDNSYGKTAVPAGLTGVTAIAAGDHHTIALKSDGTVVAWGDNTFGQTAVPGGIAGVTAIAAGDYHTVALKNDGTVVVWGYNSTGQTTVPAGFAGVTAIAAGGYHTVALKNDGTVVAWGWNYSGQTSVPAGLTGVTAIAAGGNHTVALKNNGTVVAWGSDDYSQTTVPAGLTGVTAIAAGWHHTVALKNDGTVVAWGYNGYGETTVPAGLAGVTAIAAGYNHTVALKNDGTMVAWGDNSYGKATVPVGLAGVIAIAAGGNHTVALKNDGTVVAWGKNDYGQTTVPAGLTGVIAVAGGWNFTVALKNDGTVVAWGRNDYGQTTVSVVSAYETAVNVSLGYDPETLTAILIPTSYLDHLATYTVAVAGVRSQAGVPLAAQSHWSFSTDDKILLVAPPSHDFGSVIINSAPATRTFTISNTDLAAPVVSSISIGGPDASLFSVTPGSCSSLTPTIAVGGSCTVNVAFMPTSAGSRNATLQVASPDPVNQSFGVTLSGSGVLQSLTLLLTVDGTGSGTVHSSPGTDINCITGGCAQSYDLGTTVTLSGAANSGSTFSGWSGACSGAGACTVTMDAAQSVTATFTADPVPAIIGVSPTALTFANLATYSSGTQPVTIGNSGTAPLAVLNALLSGTDAGAFFIAPGSCGSTRPTIEPGGSCQLDLIFQPTTSGSKSATFTIASNASNTPVAVVGLAGSAYDPAPFGSIAINGGANLTNNASVTLSLSAYDNSGQVTEMRFSNNNSTWSDWELFTSTKSWTLLALGGDGDKTVYVQYKDAAGNASGSFADTITFDTTAPTVTITAKPAALYTGTSGTFSFTANEAVSGYECKIDTGNFAACTGPFVFSGLADGSHTFSVRATDLAGNPGSTISYSWTIVATPPDTAITIKPDSLTTSTAGSISFTSADATATFECSLDSGAFATCSSLYSFSGLTDGSHTFSVRAKDAAGNYDLTAASYSWTIDTTPPDTSITGQPPDPAITNSGSFNFSSSEAGSTFQCSMDGAAYTTCGPPYGFSGLADGSHTFSIRAIDAIGNIDPIPAAFTWTVTTRNVRLTAAGRPDTFYTTITAALAGIPAGVPSQIVTKQLDFNETVDMNRCGETLTIRSAFDPSFTTLIGPTIIRGALIVSCGTVVADNLEII